MHMTEYISSNEAERRWNIPQLSRLQIWCNEGFKYVTKSRDCFCPFSFRTPDLPKIVDLPFETGISRPENFSPL
jgi:hypothetical protein